MTRNTQRRCYKTGDAVDPAGWTLLGERGGFRVFEHPTRGDEAVGIVVDRHGIVVARQDMDDIRDFDKEDMDRLRRISAAQNNR